MNIPTTPSEFLWLQERVRSALAEARFSFAAGIAAYYPAPGGKLYPNCYLAGQIGRPGSDLRKCLWPLEVRFQENGIRNHNAFFRSGFSRYGLRS